MKELFIRRCRVDPVVRMIKCLEVIFELLKNELRSSSVQKQTKASQRYFFAPRQIKDGNRKVRAENVTSV